MQTAGGEERAKGKKAKCGQEGCTARNRIMRAQLHCLSVPGRHIPAALEVKEADEEKLLQCAIGWRPPAASILPSV